MHTPSRIFVVDDHPVIQNGVRIVLGSDPDLEIIGTAANGDDARRDVTRLQPDLLILDLKIPGRSPLDVIAADREQSPHTKILIMSAFDDREYVRRLRDFKIEGYILKDEAPEMLLTAIHSILQGATWFSRPIFDMIVSLDGERDSPNDDNAWSKLSERDRVLLTSIGKGMSNRQIAVEMHLAEQTVRNYTSQLYDKLGLQSRAQAVIWIQSHGKNSG